MRTKVTAMVICLFVLLLTSIAAPAKNTPSAPAKSISSAPAKNMLSARQRAQSLVNKGLALSDNSAKEAEYYKKAIDIDPSYTDASFNMGIVCHSQENIEDAIKAYKMCI